MAFYFFPPESWSDASVESLPPDVLENLHRQRPDVHLLAELPTGQARLSLWITDVPPFPGQTLGALGHFFADAPEPASAILDTACAWLAERGATLAVGPLDGNTWRRYRFVTESSGRPPFLLEPANPPDYPSWFEAAGFTALARYRSFLLPDLSQADPRLERTLKRLHANGVRIRSLDPSRFEDDLRALYAVSLRSFSDNFLYTPLDEASFLAQYRPFRERLDPRFVLLAEQGGQPAGFSFSYPDPLGPPSGEPPTLIVKTVAVLPGRAYAGLGAALVALTGQAAAQVGYRQAIHALIHDANVSGNTSAKSGHAFRRYTLFARPLR